LKNDLQTQTHEATPEGIPEHLRISQAAQVLGLSKTTLRGLVRQKSVPTIQLSGFSGWHMLERATIERLAAQLNKAPNWKAPLE
jgi:predicted DNA-binding transcriptional regulator AlpA